ncbi:uncharacterized protein DUF998 [Sediminihabitans luteus]|uniref:Uncharacterized protein DUF998 n=1 Tax=Sediminihabitans luteus TaxID=1138585 RepID=A0A2M9D0L1_9CELL|nr:DUF998 domain-containing protein [Sediminihabitans luteus]PJJ77633.1 uncharacterized protein DUF998 [Sediminihabitans luteus]GII98533.1 membrane protein [Sediminihabitans luteus]
MSLRTRPRAWALVPAVLAPVAMIGGWRLAAAQQPAFDPVAQTISALAAAPSSDTWIMTAGLALTGASHVVTALGLTGLPRPGRVLLALGGVATAAVAALPVDLHPAGHTVAATVGFVALAAWPAASARRESGGPGPGVAGLPAPVAIGTTAALAALLGVFFLELTRVLPDDGAAVGLTERLVAGAQSLVPLGVVVGALVSGRPAR